MNHRSTLVERLEANVDRSGGPDACHPFTGALTEQGYARMYRGPGLPIIYAHVAAWVAVNGPVPDGLVLDHVAARGCTMRHCCNVAHLEHVTQRENLLRGDGFVGRNARKTHCKNGHRFDWQNTRTGRSGRRDCRACDRASSYRYWHRKKEAAS